MKRVLLEPAWFFRCPECHRTNFVRSEKFNGTEEEKRDIAIKLGMEEYGDPDPDIVNELLSSPGTVTCRKCTTKFDSRMIEDEGESSQ